MTTISNINKIHKYVLLFYTHPLQNFSFTRTDDLLLLILNFSGKKSPEKTMLEHSTVCTTKLSFSEQSFKERKDKAEKTIISTTALNLFFSAH